MRLGFSLQRAGMAHKILSLSVVKSYFPSSSFVDQEHLFKLLKKSMVSFSFKHPRDFSSAKMDK